MVAEPPRTFPTDETTTIETTTTSTESTTTTLNTQTTDTTDDEEDDYKEDETELCTNEMDFKVKVGYRITGDIVDKTKVRSALECATFCGKDRKCRGFTFSRDGSACTSHGAGKNKLVRGNNREKVGIKRCSEE